MRRFIWVLLYSLVSAVSHSKENSECDKNPLATQQADYFFPARWGHITAEGKTFFHSAPSTRCASKTVFVKKGDYLSIYAFYDEWLYVMFVNEKTGEDFMDWVPAANVKIKGKYEP